MCLRRIVMFLGVNIDVPGVNDVPEVNVTLSALNIDITDINVVSEVSFDVPEVNVFFFCPKTCIV